MDGFAGPGRRDAAAEPSAPDDRGRARRRTTSTPRTSATQPDLPLWELIQTAHVVARRFTEVFAAAGLTPTQFGVLAALADDDDLSQADLARIVLVRPQSMGELTASLLSRGLVDRDGTGGRGRRSGLRLTDAGRAVYERALPDAYAINRPEAVGLDGPAVTALIGHLRAVRDALADPPGHPGAAENVKST